DGGYVEDRPAGPRDNPPDIAGRRRNARRDTGRTVEEENLALAAAAPPLTITQAALMAPLLRVNQPRRSPRTGSDQSPPRPTTPTPKGAHAPPHTTPDRASRPDRPGTRRPGELTEADREAIRAATAALPPLTDQQIDALCDVIHNARRNRPHPTQRQTD